MSQSAVLTKKPSALDALKALSKKAPAPSSKALSVQTNDPAIAGAKRDKNTVHLGFDPSIAESARHAAALKEELDRAQAEFTVYQSQMRDYGKGKRDLYNETFKSNVTTVCVPYSVEAPVDGDSATPGRETRMIQVICTSKYSIAQDTIAKLRPELGETFDKLFDTETTKVLKPNAEELIRQLLAEAGLDAEELESSMETLFETKTKISAKEGYEQEIRRVPEDTRTILSQSVTRQQPGLKFPS